MTSRIVIICHLTRGMTEAFSEQVLEIISKEKRQSVYTTVNQAGQLLDSGFLPLKRDLTTGLIKLKSIINIHNIDGIRDLTQVPAMVKEIQRGRLFSSKGIPNVKLVKTKNDSLLLFDGHHSMLAYMAAGKTRLNEIPHLVIYDKETGFISDEDILVFFGEHASRILKNEWKPWVINWQEQGKRQLGKRVDQTMEQLFHSYQTKLARSDLYSIAESANCFAGNTETGEFNGKNRRSS